VADHTLRRTPVVMNSRAIKSEVATTCRTRQLPPNGATWSASSVPRSPVPTIEVFGAVGDGVTDDAAEFRSALAAAPAVSTVYGTPGKTYLLATPLRSPTFAVPSGAIPLAHMRAIPDGVTLDLRRATLRAGADAVLVTRSRYRHQHRGLGHRARWYRSRRELSAVQQPLPRAAHSRQWAAAARLHLRMVNVQHGGLALYGCDHMDAPRLEADGVVGQPYSIGYPRAALGVADSRFGTVAVDNVAPDPANTFNFTGNVLSGKLQRRSIASIVGRNCSAGIKIASYSTDLKIGRRRSHQVVRRRLRTRRRGCPRRRASAYSADQVGGLRRRWLRNHRHRHRQDDQETAIMRDGVDINGCAAVVRIPDLTVQGQQGLSVRVVPGCGSKAHTRIDGDRSRGEVAPVGSASTPPSVR